jgi:hypothetical protein
MMIKVTEAGLQAIRDYLLVAHKNGASLTGENIAAWASEAEKSDRAQIELRAFESVSGRTELFDLPINGFEFSMPINHFIHWCALAKWKVCEGSEFSDQEVHDGYDKHGEPLYAPKGYGAVWREAEALHSNGTKISVKYQCDVEWTGSEFSRYDSKFHVSPSANVRSWQVSGIELLDDDLCEVSHRDLDGYLDGLRIKFPGNPGEVEPLKLSRDQIEAILPAVKTDKVEMGCQELKEFEVERDNEPNIVFRGELVASASSLTSDSIRWTVLNLWRTVGGKFICQKIGHSRYQGEVSRYKGAICSDHQAVIAFFGYSEIAKELFAKAGIESAVQVD